MKVHLTSIAEICGYQALRYTDSFWSVVVVANAKTTLDAGFTTVRNVGSADFEDVGLKQAIEGGYIPGPRIIRSEEHTSELQSLMRISYAVFCLKKKKRQKPIL